MSSSSMKASINSLLDPLLFQVVGSTPESIRDAVKASQLRANPNAAILVACTAVFASAVNKSTLENFLSKQELIDARTVIAASFSVSGKTNMTGLTLLGHCLLTSTFVNDINFCVAFRRKLGQQHLWDGSLSGGNLSDKQREILKSKKEVTNEISARLLGSGYFKFTGIDRTAMTLPELDFWDLTDDNQRTPDRTDKGKERRVRSSLGGSPSGSVRARTVTLNDGSVATIPENLIDYYLKATGGSNERLIDSISNRGADSWIDVYTGIMARDPDGKTLGAGTVVGGN